MLTYHHAPPYSAEEGGGVQDRYLLKLSNTAVVWTPRWWLVTARPMSASDWIAGEACARCSQFEPSLDVQASTVVPVRVSFSQIGNAVGERPPTHCVSAPVAGRVRTSTRLDGVTSTMTCAADGSSDSRIMMPTFANGCVFSRLSTRTIICPSSNRLSYR